MRGLSTLCHVHGTVGMVPGAGAWGTGSIHRHKDYGPWTMYTHICAYLSYYALSLVDCAGALVRWCVTHIPTYAHSALVRYRSTYTYFICGEGVMGSWGPGVCDMGYVARDHGIMGARHGSMVYWGEGGKDI